MGQRTQIISQGAEPVSMTTKPLIVCAADLQHAQQARAVLSSCGEVLYVDPTEDSLAEYLPRADAYYASLHIRLSGQLQAKAHKLKVIATPSTGLDHIDLDYAAAHDIAVLGLKDDRSLLDKITATAELTWALTLGCARRLYPAMSAAREGRWARDEFRGHQLAYKTLGILGCGRLGSIVAEYGRAFRMRVIGCDVRDVQLAGVEMVSLARLLAESDVLSIHIHLTDENRGFLSRERIFSMKHGAILINTSRGAIVDEIALRDALAEGYLSAAGLDVIEGEWRDDLATHPLITYAREHENLLITPHVGGVTYESQAMAYEAAAQKLADFLNEHA